MELYDIRYFMALWEQKSFSKAAGLVNISQPALTQCIKKLENEFGTPLIVRSGRNIQLTEAGDLVYSYGSKMIAMSKSLNASVSEIVHRSDFKIKVGMSPFYSKYYLPSIIPHIRKQFPNISILTEEDISAVLEKKLLDGELDFCCLPQNPEIPGLVYEPICIEEILLAVPPDSPLNDYAVSSVPIPCMELRHITNQKFVALKPIQKINILLDPILKSNGIDCNVVYETLDWETVNIMIANGMGIGFVPDILCSNNRVYPNPLYYRITPNSLQRRYSIAYNSRKTLSDIERLLVTFFKTKIPEIRNQRIGIPKPV